jgi:hypothetical protein
LLVYKLPMPSEDRVGLGHRRNLCQGLLPQRLPRLSKSAAITIRPPHATANLLAEYAMLSDQVRIAQPELFIHRRRDRPEQFLPIHTAITSAKRSAMENQYGRKGCEIQGEAGILAAA